MSGCLLAEGKERMTVVRAEDVDVKGESIATRRQKEGRDVEECFGPGLDILQVHFLQHFSRFGMQPGSRPEPFDDASGITIDERSGIQLNGT